MPSHAQKGWVDKETGKNSGKGWHGWQGWPGKWQDSGSWDAGGRNTASWYDDWVMAKRLQEEEWTNAWPNDWRKGGGVDECKPQPCRRSVPFGTAAEFQRDRDFGASLRENPGISKAGIPRIVLIGVW